MTPVVLTSWNSTTQSGQASLATGLLIEIDFGLGQGMWLDESWDTPRLTGRHDQPGGGQLKVPVVGDALLVEAGSEDRPTWGYMRHYLELIERRQAKTD